jgi:hypothetical protein
MAEKWRLESYLLHSIQIDAGAIQSPFQLLPACLPLGIKRPEREDILSLLLIFIIIIIIIIGGAVLSP